MMPHSILLSLHDALSSLLYKASLNALELPYDSQRDVVGEDLINKIVILHHYIIALLLHSNTVLHHRQ